VVRFVTGREPSPAIVRDLVRVVAGRLAFQADRREGLRILVDAPDATAVDATETLLRACCGSDTVIVSPVVN
jgi:hypothetical protein